ncbi:MAG TPA: Spy/CpxP family protein refolding chaperone [Xanthobacteraceae bacterium]|nr:Spy/CpxP family protein refolding chaperone [Xanthobacteraceae bacterium]
MLKIAAAGTIALSVVTASPLALAQTSQAGDQQGMSAADTGTLTDMRINVIKTALQLTPDQEKYWPAIDKAIRARAEHRRGRLMDFATRASEVRGSNPIEDLKNRDPVAFMQRRSQALAQRATDLKNLADAWQPLYQTLSDDQKRRLAVLTFVVLRDMREAVEQRRMQSDDQDDDQGG